MGFILAVIAIYFTLMFIVVGVFYLKKEKNIQEQLKSKLQLSDDHAQASRNKAMQQSFQERVFLPAAQKTFEAIQRYIPMTGQFWVRNKLIQAGYTKPSHLKIFMGMQCIVTLGIFSITFLYTHFLCNMNLTLSLTISFGLAFLGFAFPLLWLYDKANTRKDSIQKALPNFLDLMVICVEAGMGLDMAINRVSNLKMKKQMTNLQNELKTYINEIGLGKPRKDALMGISHRTGVEDLNGLIIALVQSFEMGTDIVQVLRVYAETLREKRLEKAKEKANKIPVQMVMPIYIFLFPTIFLTIFGPMAMVLIKTAGQVAGNMGPLGQ